MKTFLTEFRRGNTVIKRIFWWTYLALHKKMDYHLHEEKQTGYATHQRKNKINTVTFVIRQYCQRATQTTQSRGARSYASSDTI